MRSKAILAATGAFALAFISGSATAAARADLYEGFTLVDPERGSETAHAWMVVRNGLIERVGSGRSPRGDFVRHDMRGTFALPGLIDAHAHIVQGPYVVSIVDGAPRIEMDVGDKYTRFNAKIALAFGITTVRNPGGSTEAASHYDAMIARDQWIGPEALHAGAIIQPPPLSGEAFTYPASEPEWDAEAARQAHAGMTYFKLYQDLNEDELSLGIAAARKHGLIPIAHLDEISWTRAAELGIAQFEHAQPFSPALLPKAARADYAIDPLARFMFRWFALADLDGPEIAEMLRTLRERRAAVTLTLMANEVVFNVKDLSAIFPPDELLYYQPESLASARANFTAIASAWTDEDAAQAKAAWPRTLQFAKLLHDAGVPLMIGTDSTGGTPFYARELAHHVAAGIPPMEVLRMATSGNAELMGLSDTGRIAPGLEADILFLRANPAQDVRNVREIELILSNGRPYRFDELVAQAQELAD